MKPEVLNPNDYPNTLTTEKFLHLEGFFYLNYDCIMTEKKTVNVLDNYDLVEFIDDGDIDIRNVRFWTAILKDDILKIVVRDTESNQVLHRTHPFNDESPCDWLLVEKNYFNNDLLEF